MVEEMQVQSGIYNDRKMLREMVALYQWMLKEVCAGRQILSEDAVRQKRTICRTDSIENIQRRMEKYNYGNK